MSFLLILILFISITFHEYAHGWIADRLGDPTPRNSGRLTLNPIAHIDPFGTLLLPILLFMVSRGAFSFGYAKPIPIKPYHFKNPKRDMQWVGISGPAANILIVLILTFLLRTKILVSEVIVWGVIINLILAIFNLVPIPPLDGSRIVVAWLPHRLAASYLRMESYGFIIIAILILGGFFNWFILPLVTIALDLLRINVML